MKIDAIRSEVSNCKQCELYKTKNKYVFGEGNPNADIVFIGEAPGANEDKTGKPFVGRAGQIFDELLNSVGIDRKDIFVCNILKCRPSENRNPKEEEITACTPYLNKQLEIIKPKIICTLGNYSTIFIFKKYGLKNKIEGISKIHGKKFSIKNLYENMILIPLYHPAVATYNPDMKNILLADIKNCLKK